MPFPKGISPKVNVIAQLEFGLTHYNVAVQHRGIRGFVPFPKGISSKVNVIPQLEFELTHYNVAVQHRGIRGFVPFPKAISPKVNVIPQLEFELAYYKATVQEISHYTMGTSHFINIWLQWKYFQCSMTFFCLHSVITSSILINYK